MKRLIITSGHITSKEGVCGLGEGIHVASKIASTCSKKTPEDLGGSRGKGIFKRSQICCLSREDISFLLSCNSFTDTVSIKSLLSLLSSVGTYDRKVLNNSNNKCFVELIKQKFTEGTEMPIWHTHVRIYLLYWILIYTKITCKYVVTFCVNSVTEMW